MKLTEDIAKAIRRHRSELGLNQEDYSKRFGVRYAAISRWENCKQPTIDDEHWAKLEPEIKPFMKPSVPTTQPTITVDDKPKIIPNDGKSLTIICNQVTITLNIKRDNDVGIDIHTNNDGNGR